MPRLMGLYEFVIVAIGCLFVSAVLQLESSGYQFFLLTKAASLLLEFGYLVG
jgi:hypothetical protein